MHNPKLIQVMGLILVFAGCASPSLEFPRTPEAVKVVDQVTLSLFRSGSRVQVIRTGKADKIRREEMPQQMVEFVHAETRCTLDPKKTTADSVVLTGVIKCKHQ